MATRWLFPTKRFHQNSYLDHQACAPLLNQWNTYLADASSNNNNSCFLLFYFLQQQSYQLIILAKIAAAVAAMSFIESQLLLGLYPLIVIYCYIEFVAC
jgi:hypothetical protein